MKAKLSPQLDAFSQRQLPYVARVFREEQERHRRQADVMWLGTLVQFSDHELRLLHKVGSLCQHDLDLLARARRFL